MPVTEQGPAPRRGARGYGPQPQVVTCNLQRLNSSQVCCSEMWRVSPYPILQSAFNLNPVAPQDPSARSAMQTYIAGTQVKY